MDTDSPPSQSYPHQSGPSPGHVDRPPKVLPERNPAKHPETQEWRRQYPDQAATPARIQHRLRNLEQSRPLIQLLYWPIISGRESDYRRRARSGMLTQVKVGRRNRAFEAPELIEAFTALERQLASPEGDTRLSPPARRVPRRPRG